MQGEKNEELCVEIVPEGKSKKEKKKSFWSINKETLPYKLHYFLFVGGMGAILPYGSVVGMTRYGLQAGNLATTFTAQQLLFILFKPAIGYMTDYFNKLKAMIVGLTVLQAFFWLIMVIIPATDVSDMLQSYKLQVPLSDFNKCLLCNNYEEFIKISSDLPLDESLLEKGISCLQNSLNDVEQANVHCPEQNDSFYMEFKIVYSGCNTSFGNGLLSTTNLNVSLILDKNDLYFITMSINRSETIGIICVLPKIIPSNFIESYNNFSLIKDHCYFDTKLKLDTLQTTLLPNFLSNQNIMCGNNESSYVKEQHVVSNSSLTTEIFKTYQFWIFSLCLLTSSLFSSSIFTISDTACYEGVQKTGSDYGRQRTWGQISWGFVAPLAGFINDYADSYLPSWCLMMVLCTLQIWNLSKMDLVKPGLSKNILKDLKTVFSSMEFIAFEIGVFMNGVFTGVIWFYLTWFLATIGGTGLIIGLDHTVMCLLGDVPFLFFSNWMIQKLGHFNVVSLALFAHGVRFFVYSYLHNPWWILPVDVLHGFTFGSFIAAVTSYGKLNSKPGTEATTQSVLCTTFEAMGAGLGCFIGGIFFERFGAHTTYFYAAFVCVLSTGINVMFTILLKHKKEAIEETKQDSEHY